MILLISCNTYNCYGFTGNGLLESKNPIEEKCHVAITGSYMGLDLIEDDGYFEIEH